MEPEKLCSQCGATASNGNVCDACADSCQQNDIAAAQTIPPSASAAASTANSMAAMTVPPGASADGLSQSESVRLAPGTTFGGFELIEEIARGGMGVVYRAKQKALNRTVALKMILGGQLASKDDVQRFLSEAEAAAKLEHSGIVPIYDIGEVNGQHYFSMPLIEGPSLADRLIQGPLPSIEAATLLEQVARAVHYAHEQGIVHRDLKPSNILLDQNRSAKVTDFGLAKNIREDSGMTATGQIMGTAGYMPPEQAKGDTIDRRSDVYSIGAILYCLLTGRPPFQSATQMDTLLQVLSQEPIPPKQLNPAISTDLQTIALKCLQKNQTRRYDTAEEVADELRRVLEGRPIVARPVSTTERAWRWCQRNKWIARLLTGLVISIVAGVIGVFIQWRRAEVAYELAKDKVVKLVETEGTLAQELYTSNLLRGDALKLAGLKRQAENLYWQLEEEPIQFGDRRAWWRLWEHYWQEPRDGFVPFRGGRPAISEAAKIIAVVDGSQIHLADIVSFEMQRTLKSEHGAIHQVKFSPDGSRLVASHTGNSNLSVWNLDGSDSVLILKSQHGLELNEFETQALNASAGPQFIESFGDTLLGSSQLHFLSSDQLLQVDWNGVHLWQLPMVKETLIAGTRLGIQAPQEQLIGVSTDGSRVWMRQMSFTSGPSISQYEINDGKALKTMLGVSNSKLTSINSDDSDQEIRPLEKCLAAVSNDGSRFATLEDSTPAKLTIWNLENNEQLVERENELTYPDNLGELRFSHDGRHLVLDAETKMTLYATSDLKTIASIDDLPQHSEFGGVVADAQGQSRWLISEQEARFNNTKKMQLAIRPLKQSTPVEVYRANLVGQVKLGPQGNSYVAGMLLDDVKYAISRERKGEMIAKYEVDAGSYGVPIAFSADGSTFASIDKERNLFVLDGQTMGRKQSRRLECSPGVIPISLSPDGSSIAFIVPEGKLHICDTASLESRLVQEMSSLIDGSLAFSNTGKWLIYVGVSAGQDLSNTATRYDITVLDVESGTEVATESITSRRPAVLFEEDDLTLYFGAKDMTVFSVPNLVEIDTWETSDDEIQSMAANSEEQLLFCGTTSGKILVIDTRLGQENIAIQVTESRIGQLRFDKARNAIRFSSQNVQYLLDLDAPSSRIDLNRVTRKSVSDEEK